MTKIFVIVALCAFSASAFGGESAPDQFIVGGIPANIADFPHQLALLDMVRGGATGYMYV